jgi:hypothetical protein
MQRTGAAQPWRSRGLDFAVTTLEARVRPLGASQRLGGPTGCCRPRPVSRRGIPLHKAESRRRTVCSLDQVRNDDTGVHVLNKVPELPFILHRSFLAQLWFAYGVPADAKDSRQVLVRAQIPLGDRMQMMRSLELITSNPSSDSVSPDHETQERRAHSQDDHALPAPMLV